MGGACRSRNVNEREETTCHLIMAAMCKRVAFYAGASTSLIAEGSF
jgi:hypothetical protein